MANRTQLSLPLIDAHSAYDYLSVWGNPIYRAVVRKHPHLAQRYTFEVIYLASGEKACGTAPEAGWTEEQIQERVADWERVSEYRAVRL